jgi:large subunit ribosomal protein L25
VERVRLMAYRRAGKDNGDVRRLRREGKLPAVLYGPGRQEAISVDAQALRGILESEAGENTLIDLFINGDPPERCPVKLRTMQTHSASPAPFYADFYRVSIDER